MKFRNIIAGVAVAAGLVSAVSCQDWLDIKQHSVVNIDSFYKTDDEAEEGIVAVYNQFKSIHSGGTSAFNAQSMGFLTTFLADEVWAGGGSRADGGYYQYSEFTFGTDNAMIKNMYSGLYTLIYRANLIIGRVTPDSEIKSRAVAEAKVFRAWADFELVTLWGTAPLVNKVLEEKEYMQSNSTVDELWASIEADLNAAISSGHLTSKKEKSSVTYRATKEFAQALLGKAYLWQKKYSEAAEAFEKVIGTGLFELQSDLTNFGTAEGVASPEDVFVMRAVNDPSNAATNITFHGTYTGLRGEKYSYESNSPFWSWTWGFQVGATKKLYDTFVKIEGKNGYRLNNFVITYDALRNNYGTSINKGMDVYDNEGYYNFKYRIVKSNGSAYFYPLTDHIMRYDEVLLLAAESQLQAGNSAKALTYLNQIRKRAQAPEASSVDLQTIKDESFVELCFEGLRYQNLLRWGDAAEALKDRGVTHPHCDADGNVTYKEYNESGKVGFMTGKHELLPFPADEMSVNANMKQNPGW